jgi:DNA mismatch repair protein MutS
VAEGAGALGWGDGLSSSARDTPMMRHFLQIKAQHPNAIVLYRMGDFYELFLEDAERAAPLLDLTLTTRDKAKKDPVPMCGFPVHSADGYIKRLAELGHRVAICEQVEDPRSAGGKRLVRREVVEVVTPGLVGDPEGLDGGREVALVAIAPAHDGEIGLAALDATTGDFRATRVRDESGPEAAPGAEGTEGAGEAPGWPGLVWEELERISPREVLVEAEVADVVAARLRELLPEASLSVVDAARFDPAEVPVAPEGLAALGSGADARAAAALLSYLVENQPFAAAQVPRLRPYALGDTMVLDASTRAHLELFENGIDRSRRDTLIAQVDETTNPLGARRLARWLGYPLLDTVAIRERQDAVAFLADRDRLRARLRDALGAVRDLERLLAKALRPSAVPRDLGTLRTSLQALPEVRALLEEGEGAAGSSLLASEDGKDVALPSALAPPSPVPELQRLLEESLIDDPPVIARGSRGANETGYIREGFRAELDALRESAGKGREWIAGLEVQERERTGIATLKVRYHPVHGYSLEVTKSQLDRVPDHYERKQTLANVERFTTEELSEMQGKVIGANERAAELEREIFESVRQQVVGAAEDVRAAAERVAVVDALGSLAEVARRRRWVRPEVGDGERLEIRAGRHPVVEDVLSRASGDGFVPNDADLDPSQTQILLLTGPNMSGKSTYLRQVALIVLLAQTGSFVPADSASVGIVDRIFTRVGASDRLARGESTFMVEMRETAEILGQASRRSLIILDEIGRGTSTFDGLSIAWAVAEYLHDTPGLGSRTLFATHYHELTDLARTKERVHNAHFEAREWKEEVVFLRRLVSGGANRSYGIQVARLAGLPDDVIARARQILHNLEAGELTPEGLPRLARAEDARSNGAQLSLGLAKAPSSGASPTEAEQQVLEALRGLDPDRTTPMDALVALQDLAARLRDDPTGESSS